jgi:hypothetical protein
MADAAATSSALGNSLDGASSGLGTTARRESGIGGRAETLALGPAKQREREHLLGVPWLRDWVGGSPNLRRSIRRHPADFIEPAQIAVRRRASKQKRPRRTAFNFLIFLRKSGAGEGIRTLDPNLGKVVLYP